MSLLDKKMFLRDLEERLGEFVPGNLIPMITAQAGEALAAYDVNGIPEDGRTSTARICYKPTSTRRRWKADPQRRSSATGTC